MKIIEIEGKEYRLPESWDEVTIETFNKIAEVSMGLSTYKSDYQFSVDMFQVITGAPKDDLLKMTRRGFETMTTLTDWIKDEIPKKEISKWNFAGFDWVAITDLNSLSMGDSISLEILLKDSEQHNLLSNILPFLVRKAKSKIGSDGKEILVPGDLDMNEYNEIKNILNKNMFIGDVMHLQGFFLDGGNQSSITMKGISVKGKRSKTKENQSH
jgi:hypothetical protein